MDKADYTRIAAFYDKGRHLSEQNTDLWLGLIADRGARGARVLDLGCGTGRFALPMAERLGCRVTGADASEAMLGKARGKDTQGLVRWDCQHAQRLTYPDGSFDVVFMSHLLHHVDSPPRVLRECHRVLAVPGTVLVRYGAMEQIRADPEHTFFPEALAIDEARTPTVAMTEQWLGKAGFADVSSEEVVQQTYRTAQDRVNAASLKNTSVLTMISQQAFGQGTPAFGRYATDHADDPWLLFDRLTLTVGYRRQ